MFGRCGHCGHDVIIQIDLGPVQKQLDRIEATVNREGFVMGQVDDELAQVKTGVATLIDGQTTLLTDQARVLTDLRNALSGTGALTPAQTADFQGVIDALGTGATNLAAGQAALDAGDPLPPVTPPTP